jgi:hypothetical protein
MTEQLRVMISSQCRTLFPYHGGNAELSVIRADLKTEIENSLLFGNAPFQVWINEDAPGAEGTQDWWDHCISQVTKAHIVIVLYNGHAGSQMENGDVGICHAELEAAISKAPEKIRSIRLTPLDQNLVNTLRHKRFQDFYSRQSLFAPAAATGEEIIACVKAAIFDALMNLSK